MGMLTIIILMFMMLHSQAMLDIEGNLYELDYLLKVFFHLLGELIHLGNFLLYAFWPPPGIHKDNSVRPPPGIHLDNSARSPPGIHLDNSARPRNCH